MIGPTFATSAVAQQRQDALREAADRHRMAMPRDDVVAEPTDTVIRPRWFVWRRARVTTPTTTA
jgi:hypothetical protein